MLQIFSTFPHILCALYCRFVCRSCKSWTCCNSRQQNPQANTLVWILCKCSVLLCIFYLSDRETRNMQGRQAPVKSRPSPSHMPPALLPPSCGKGWGMASYQFVWALGSDRAIGHMKCFGPRGRGRGKIVFLQIIIKPITYVLEARLMYLMHKFRG